MDISKFYRVFAIIIASFLIFLILKFTFPVFVPFLAGGLLSFTAEPAVRFGCKRLGLRRGISAVAGVGLTLAIILCAAVAVGGLAVREVRSLTGLLPQLEQAARSGMATLEDGLITLTQQLPSELQPTVQKSITGLFSGQDSLSSLTVRRLPEMAASLAGKVPAGALGAGTGVLAAFLISARLPRLKALAGQYIPEQTKLIWHRAKGTLGKWALAQLKLVSVTFAIVCTGMLLLRIPSAPIWAVVAALVDAVPLLGTGVLLLPWALVLWLQGDVLKGIGLVCVYGAAALTRAVLEPRLVGKQLGLDPLAALAALYAGFRLWGFWGLVLAPVGTSLIKNVLFQTKTLSDFPRRTCDSQQDGQ